MSRLLRHTVALAALTAAATALAQSPIDPAEGFWYDPARPGSGFSLERRGDTVALTAYDFADHLGATAANRWRLAAAPLVGDTVVATLQSYANGSCFGCDAFAAAEPQPETSTLRLTFDSARSAMLQVDELPPRRFVSLPYGSNYAVAPFDTAGVPLPDLRGRWVFASPTGNNAGSFEVLSMEVQDAQLVFRGNGAVGSEPGNLYIDCEAPPDGTPRCRILDTWGSPPVEIGVFAIADITEDRMTGTVGPDHIPVVAYRIGDQEVQP